MLETFLVNNIAFAILLWAILYIGDYALTIRAARLYQAGANQHFGFGGSYELTPYYQKDVNTLRTVSPRFLIAFILSSAMLALIWALAVPLVRIPAIFSFALGMMVLMESVVHLRHWRNLYLFGQAAQGRGITGKIDYERWLTLHSSAVEFFCVAVIYLFVALIASSWFFLGGTFGCLAVASRHRLWGQRAKEGPKSFDTSGTAQSGNNTKM